MLQLQNNVLQHLTNYRPYLDKRTEEVEFNVRRLFRHPKIEISIKAYKQLEFDFTNHYIIAHNRIYNTGLRAVLLGYEDDTVVKLMIYAASISCYIQKSMTQVVYEKSNK